MTLRKTYGQYCGLARALDTVGDRWTLLIVRELLLGARTFRELAHALEGISPNLLTDRLRVLADDGLVQRNDGLARSKTVAYRLTEAGTALEPVVLAFIRWGAPFMMRGPGQDLVDPRWTVLALRALLDGTKTRRRRGGVVHVHASGVPLTIRIREGRRSVHQGLEGAAGATIAAPMTALLSAAYGLGGLQDEGARMGGDIALIGEALTAGM